MLHCDLMEESGFGFSDIDGKPLAKGKEPSKPFEV